MELFCSSSVYLFGKLVFSIGKIQLSNYRRSIMTEQTWDIFNYIRLRWKMNGWHKRKLHFHLWLYHKKFLYECFTQATALNYLVKRDNVVIFWCLFLSLFWWKNHTFMNIMQSMLWQHIARVLFHLQTVKNFDEIIVVL